MRLWRLSSTRRARDFDGGFGLANAGRWNTRGRAVTYCSTVPSLASLEKRVTVAEVLLCVPSVIMPVPRAPDRNVLINHRTAGVDSIKIVAVTPFTLDPRLFRT